MNNLYFIGGVYSFQKLIDPVLESELRKCKTQEERDKLTETYQSTMIIGFFVAIVVGAFLCGVISLFTN